MNTMKLLFAASALSLCMTPVFASEHCEFSEWGAEDQIGNANLINRRIGAQSVKN